MAPASSQVALGLLNDHARQCVMTAGPDDRPEKTEELVAAVARLIGHG
jgi:CsoR family transcriptional regulator, copper-sensing transcriptional repressor